MTGFIGFWAGGELMYKTVIFMASLLTGFIVTAGVVIACEYQPPTCNDGFHLVENECVPNEVPLTHLTCRENACVVVEGEGDNTCKVNADCQPVVPPPPPPSQPQGHGDSPSGPSSFGTLECNGDYPAAPIIYGFKEINSSEVKFLWHPSTSPTDYQIVRYGYADGSWDYGIPQLDSSASEVNLANLGPHTQVWAQVGAIKNACLSWSKSFDP